eukprot:TRINITY_DN723_c0_g1_i2.p2 TRINITY_DN723_c0_g1~~TRINITY_DN723_c0_g1_i2.p2  ORF type:complete len:434 (-),score=127.58 TRINITY_DN723_c0_g1_i2:2063-3364(-)
MFSAPRLAFARATSARVVSLAPLASSVRMTVRASSRWANVKKGPEDPILGITVAFNKDTDARKMNLGVGAYRDDNNKPFVLESVRRAEKKIAESNPDHEYAPIVGVAAFNKASAELALGKENPVFKDKRITTVQSLSGTGALRLAAAYLGRFYKDHKVYMPNPTWGNHIPIFKDSGCEIAEYRYYDDKTCGLNLEGMLADIKAAPKGSVMLLHACAHNPTGVDPTLDQWREISKACKERDHFVLFDCAYQGFASGNPEKDVAAVKMFIEEGHNIGLCQSFAKNFGLYGERIGALSFVAKDQAEAEIIESQVKILARPMYSNPPVYGARVVSTILSDAELSALWRKEVKLMADRIITMRASLVEKLKALGSKKDWSHITNQIGMFSYTGLSEQQCDKLINEHHVYLVRNGRISIAGITSKNVDHLAKSIHEVTK